MNQMKREAGRRRHVGWSRQSAGVREKEENRVEVPGVSPSEMSTRSQSEELIPIYLYGLLLVGLCVSQQITMELKSLLFS